MTFQDAAYQAAICQSIKLYNAESYLHDAKTKGIKRTRKCKVARVETTEILGFSYTAYLHDGNILVSYPLAN
jgi:hypothetical protein